MDLDFLEDVQNAPKQENFIDIHSETEVNVHYEQCPKCQNFSILDSTCESCHYEKPAHLLGEPLGHRSFYTMREKYLGSLSLFEKTNISILKDQGKYKSLINRTKLRYNDLLDYFYSDVSLDDSQRHIFLQELTDIIIFFIDAGIDEDEIWFPINDKSVQENDHTNSLFLLIKETIRESKLKSNESRFEFLMLDRRVSKLLILFLTTMLVFAFSFAFISIYNSQMI